MGRREIKQVGQFQYAMIKAKYNWNVVQLAAKILSPYNTRVEFLRYFRFGSNARLLSLEHKSINCPGCSQTTSLNRHQETLRTFVLKTYWKHLCCATSFWTIQHTRSPKDERGLSHDKNPLHLLVSLNFDGWYVIQYLFDTLNC